MQCCYLNLDAAPERRGALERRFAACAPSHWRLRRVRATDAVQVAGLGLPGTLRAAEKACFLSHREALRAAAGDEGSLLVLEDDVELGAAGCRMIEDFATRHGDGAWDIAYTDVCVPQMETMAGLVRLRQRWSPQAGVMLLDLRSVPYAGATAYLVNARARRRLLERLDAVTQFDVPYDLYLRDLVHAREFAGLVIFPFATTLARAADTSQIQPVGLAHEHLWNTFRRMIWVERRLADFEPVLADITARLCDPEALPFAPLFAAMASSRYQP